MISPSKVIDYAMCEDSVRLRGPAGSSESSPFAHAVKIFKATAFPYIYKLKTTYRKYSKYWDILNKFRNSSKMDQFDFTAQ